MATETFAEWRRDGSTCRGALVFALSDLAPGAGWGVLDHTHRPKSTFRALARAFVPVAIGITDEGVNGLHLHLTNETGEALDCEVEVFALRDGSVKVCPAGRRLTLGPRAQTTLRATELLGSFYDYGYAYRFGPADHDVVVARLRVGGEVVSEAFSFPLGRSAAVRPSHVTAELGSDDAGRFVDLVTDTFAQSVHIDVASHEPDDDWFHLAPDRPRRIRFTPLPGTDPALKPAGAVRTLAGGAVRFQERRAL